MDLQNSVCGGFTLAQLARGPEVSLLPACFYFLTSIFVLTRNGLDLFRQQGLGNHCVFRTSELVDGEQPLRELLGKRP